MNTANKPFHFKDCTLLPISCGLSALNLRELRDGIFKVPRASLYYHFWGRFLGPRMDEPEFNNDIASWINSDLHDRILAERVSALNPVDFESLDSLRQDLIDLIEERLDECEMLSWGRASRPFYFIHSQMVSVETGILANNPLEFARHFKTISVGSIFYHFLDARLRYPIGRNDFSVWLEHWDDSAIATAIQIEDMDPFFSSLHQLRTTILNIMTAHNLVTV